MPRVSLTVRPCVIALLFLVPAVARGGPIAWEISAELAPSSPGEPFPALLLTGDSIHAEYMSRLTANGPVTKTGWRTVQLGDLTPDWSVTPDTHGLPGSGFWLTVSVRDIASGQTATVKATATATETIVFADDNHQIPISRTEAVNWDSPTSPQSFSLGGTPYAIQLSAATGPDGSARFYADVHAGAANLTPEPATFALCGIGLGVLGFGAVRRKFAM